MKLDTAEKIKSAADTMGVELRVHKDYSGRGMYGSSTTAISGDQTDIIKAAAYAAYEMGRDNEDVDDFIDDLKFRWDNLGHDDLAY